MSETSTTTSAPDTSKVSGNVCPGCGVLGPCGVAAGESQCWCMALPVLPPERRTGSGCYCPTCLAALTQASA